MKRKGNLSKGLEHAAALLEAVGGWPNAHEIIRRHREGIVPKLHAIEFTVGVDQYVGPVPWTNYPYGVELAQAPTMTCDKNGAHIRLIVRCDPDVGRRMCWTPMEKPADSSQGKRAND